MKMQSPLKKDESTAVLRINEGFLAAAMVPE